MDELPLELDDDEEDDEVSLPSSPPLLLDPPRGDIVVHFNAKEKGKGATRLQVDVRTRIDVSVQNLNSAR